MTDDRIQRVNEHYGRGDLYEVILEELGKAGVDPAHPTTDDLAPFDHFHGGGKAATLGLLELAEFPRQSRILDIGGGYGGPARTVSQLLDAHVTVLDLTEEFIRVGQRLTELTGLSNQVEHRLGDALDLPFPDVSFDAVWMQNATMNIPDKERLFQEIHRVVRPGGRLAMQDPLAGPVQPILFPTNFATDASMCFLRNEADSRAMMEKAGFRIRVWQRATEGGGSLGQSRAGALVRATDVEQTAANSKRNTDEDRMLNMWIVADRD